MQLHLTHWTDVKECCTVSLFGRIKKNLTYFPQCFGSCTMGGWSWLAERLQGILFNRTLVKVLIHIVWKVPHQVSVCVYCCSYSAVYQEIHFKPSWCSLHTHLREYLIAFRSFLFLINFYASHMLDWNFIKLSNCYYLCQVLVLLGSGFCFHSVSDCSCFSFSIFACFFCLYSRLKNE